MSIKGTTGGYQLVNEMQPETQWKNQKQSKDKLIKNKMTIEQFKPQPKAEVGGIKRHQLSLLVEQSHLEVNHRPFLH